MAASIAAIPHRTGAAAPSGQGRSGVRLWLALGLLYALALALLVPPFEVPDENAHFFRAYALSEGVLHGRVENGNAGSDLPVSLQGLVRAFLGDALPERGPPRAHPWRQTLGHLATPLQPEARAFTDYSTQAFYSPLGYVPQAAAIALGRGAGLGPLALLYAARIANPLAGMALIALALRCVPWMPFSIVAIAGLPMSMSLLGSTSADGQVIASALLFVALAQKGLRSGTWSILELLALFVTGAVFTSVKTAYGPLLLLPLPALVVYGLRRRLLLGALLVPLAVVAFDLGWLAYARDLVVIHRPGLQPDNAQAQMAYVLAHPAFTVFLIIRTMGHNAVDFFQQMVGVFGWIQLRLPAAAYATAGVGLLAAVVAEAGRMRQALRWSIAWNALLVLGALVLIGLALYLAWTPPGTPYVDGLQGRYFIPLLPLALGSAALLASGWTRPSVARVAGWVCLASLSLTAAITLATVVTGFALLS